ncbi:MAG: hypothetical protein AB7G37_09325 [Solirubrobacteraceae bacterium]
MTGHPLDAVIAEASGLEVGGWPMTIVRRDAPGDGFERSDELHRPGPRLAACVDASAALGGTEHRHVGAQWWFERCAFLVTGAAIAFALTSRRMPSLRACDTFIVESDGIPAALGIADAPLVLDRPGVTDAELASVAREQIEGHLMPLAEAISTARLRSPVPLWRSAGDRTVQAALWVGSATDRREETVALARGILAPGTRMHVPVRLSAPLEDPTCEHLRRSCCLAHRSGTGTICTGCPRTHGRDRPPRSGPATSLPHRVP